MDVLVAARGVRAWTAGTTGEVGGLDSDLHADIVPSSPVCSRSGRRLTSIFGGVAGGAARFGDLVEEREEIVEEVVLWARAGGVVVGVGALTVDQGEVGGRDV